MLVSDAKGRRLIIDNTQVTYFEERDPKVALTHLLKAQQSNGYQFYGVSSDPENPEVAKIKIEGGPAKTTLSD